MIIGAQGHVEFLAGLKSERRLALLHGKLRYWSDSGFTLEAILPENEEASNFL